MSINTSMIYILGIGNWTWYSYNPISPLFFSRDRLRVRPWGSVLTPLRFREDWVMIYQVSTKKWISLVINVLKESLGNLTERFMHNLLTHKNNTKWSWTRWKRCKYRHNDFLHQQVRMFHFHITVSDI